MLKSGLGDCLPFLLQQLTQILKSCSRRIVGTYTSPKHVPEVFYGIHVRGSSRPVHPDNPLLLQKGVDYCSTVARCIVVLEQGAVANGLQRG